MIPRHFLCSLAVVSLFAPRSLEAVPGGAYAPRAQFGAPLELPGVIHGGGQDVKGFSNYAAIVGSYRPLLYKMYYNLTKEDLDAAFEERVAHLRAHEKQYGDYVILEIGLSMTVEKGKEKTRADDNRVAAGEFDGRIDAFCRKLKDLGRPAFVRIGFECNGPWNGYRPEPYRQAYARVAKKLRESGTDTANVWCTAFIGNSMGNVMDFYPGDEWVDWWGVDLFSPHEMTAAETVDFIEEAAKRKKPVMFPETTPRGVGVLDGEKSWNAWHGPFFNLIKSQPAVKAFAYINWNWAGYPQWKTWGDARLEMNEEVATRWREEMALPLYQHGLPETHLRAALGRKSASVPGPVTAARVTPMKNGARLDWEGPIGAEVLRYEISRNGEWLGTVAKAPFMDRTVPTDRDVAWIIEPVGMDGRRPVSSVAATWRSPSRIERLRNGDFSEGVLYWSLKFQRAFEASMEVRPIPDNGGRQALRVTVTKGGENGSAVQLSQRFPVYRGKSYRLSITGRSVPPQKITARVFAPRPPWATVFENSLELSESLAAVEVGTFRAAADDSVVFTLLLGEGNDRQIDFAALSLVEE